MSTTFEVYPTVDAIPTFGQVIESNSRSLSARLARLGASAGCGITYQLRSSDDDQPLPPEANDAFQWPETLYGWFTVANVGGGTDAYFEPIDEITLDV